MPEPLLSYLDNIPGALLLAVIASPLVAIIIGVVNWLTTRSGQKLNNRVEKHEAKTHEFSAIVEGFETLLTQQKDELVKLRDRVDRLEGYQKSLIDHVVILESMIPIPPGPPPRPNGAWF